LLQLLDHHCRWPIGDPRGHRFYFCAADREAGVPYCSFHMRKAFAKPRGLR
jgi:GcrA cell cycle regulator